MGILPRILVLGMGRFQAAVAFLAWLTQNRGAVWSGAVSLIDSLLSVYMG